MKVRLTILTENDKPLNEKLTEEMIIIAWQTVLNMMGSLSENGDKAIVEKVEILEEAK